MRNVFLVDDEIVIREGIRNSFPWEDSGFTLCGEAPDGEIALPMLQDLKPDILITDIRMPFMDGLALARQVTQTMPWMHIIILSGHDDFDYAREAITLGVKEYLLKPVSAQKLEAVLRRVGENIERERRDRADLEMLRAQMASSARYVRTQLLTRLLEGEDAGPLLEQARAMRLSMDAAQFLVMLLEHVPQEEHLPVQGVLHRVAEGAGGRAHATAAGGHLALVVLGDGTADIEERAYGLAQALEYDAAQSGLPAPAVAIGAPVEHAADLPRAMASAWNVLRTMRGQPRRIVGSMDLALPAELVEGAVTPLYETLRYLPLDEAPGAVRAAFTPVDGEAEPSLILMHYKLVDLLVAATRIVRESGGNPAQVLPAHLLLQGELQRISQSTGAALAAGTQLVRAALSFRDGHMFSRYGEILRKACAYIEENHARPEMTLQDVANHVALSNNHFCTIFSQEMGKTFIEYLTDLRMQKAKALLLAGDIRSSDLAAAVGYNDPHYFGYLFKKHVGQSPRDFRKEMRA